MTKQDIIHNQKGFTLLELILAVSIMGVLGLGLITVIDEIAKREVARATAKYMQRASDAAVALLNNPVFFDHFYQDVAEDGGRKTYSLDMFIGRDTPDPASDDLDYVDINTGLSVVADIPDSKILSASFRPANPYRAPIEYILHIPAGSGVGLNPRALEVFVVTTRRVADSRVRSAAAAAGPSGGFFSAVGESNPASPSRIRSAFGVWEVDIANLAGTTWHTDVTGPDVPTEDDGAYLLHYAYVNEDIASGDYLYRIPVSNRPDLNRMRAPIVMNQNSVLGADNALVDGTVNIAIQAIARGSVRTTGNNGNLRSFGSMIADERVQAQGMSVTNTFDQVTRDTYDFNPIFTGANTMEVDDLEAVEQIQAQTANLDTLNARSITADRSITVQGNLAANELSAETGLIDVRELRTIGSGVTNITASGQSRIQAGQFTGGPTSLRTIGQDMGILTYQNTSPTSQTTVLGNTTGYRINTNRALINPAVTINCEQGC